MPEIIYPVEGRFGPPFGTIMADPPWRFDNVRTRAAAEGHYSTMSVEEICAMQCGLIAAEDAHLYLWVTAAHLGAGLEVMRAWGFRYVQNIVWVKVKNERLQIGLGNYYRHAHELCLFGVRGRAPVNVHNLPTVFWAPRGKHSSKPDEIYSMIEKASPGPYLEIFSRRARPWWARYGLEAPIAEEM